MIVNASNLKENTYQLLDDVLNTGKPLDIERNGRRLKIVSCCDDADRLARLVKHDCIVGDAEDLIHNDWSKEWSQGEIL